MRILVAISCWNEADVIGATLDSVLRQTYAVEEVLIVDNASTDGTAELEFPEIVTLVRNPLDLGITGGVTTALGYARDHGYDWLWILDGDSRPRPDALELLARLVEAVGPGARPEIGVVGPSHNLLNFGKVLRGAMLTPGGVRMPRLTQGQNYVECDIVIWSGALINLAVVERAGLPRIGTLGYWDDMSMDYSDTEYMYRIRRAGYRILVHCDSVIDHLIGEPLRRRILGHDFYSTNHSASRRYLYLRNMVFFWLRIYPRKNWPMLLVWFGYEVGVILAKIVLLEPERGRKLRACLVGISDGLRGRVHRSFQAHQ